MRKPEFCIGENKVPADQRLCFRSMDSEISHLPKSEILSS